MKTLAPAAMAAIKAGEAIVSGAVEIVPRDGGTVIRLWGGFGPITFGGNTYQGVGAHGLAQQTSGAIGGVAQGFTLTLSGIDPKALALVDPAEVKGALVTLYRLIFAVDAKTLLDWAIFDRGRGDTLTADETIGADAAINFVVESAARALGRSGARMRADPDQRLISSTDGYFKFVDIAAEKMLYWGGQVPANAGSVISPPTGNFGS